MSEVIHIFTRPSFYSNEFISFVKTNYSFEKHKFFYKRTDKNSAFEQQKDKEFHHIRSRFDLIFRVLPILKKSDSIIFHSFPISYSLIFWFFNQSLLKKSIWSIWGYDLYWYRYAKKNTINFLFEILRKILIKKVKIILCPIPGDYNYAINIYKTKAEHHYAMYPIPTNFILFDKYIDNIKANQTIKIQIGNSSTKTNYHIDAFEKLKKFKTENIEIYTPLSYGDMEYSKKVVKAGKLFFMNKFKPIHQFMDKNEYVDYLAGIDVLIMNNDRQQGLGNIISFLYLGKKVYVRDKSLIDYFNSINIKIYDILEIDKYKYIYELHSIDKGIVDSNRKGIIKLVSMKNLREMWDPILI